MLSNEESENSEGSIKFQHSFSMAKNLNSSAAKRLGKPLNNKALIKGMQRSCKSDNLIPCNKKELGCQIEK